MTSKTRTPSALPSIGLLLALAAGCGDDGGSSSGADSSGAGTTRADGGSTTASAPTTDSGSTTAVTTGGPVDCGPVPTSPLEVVETYGSAWNEPDAAVRTCLLELSWTDDGVYTDPTGVAEGRDALVALIGGFQGAFPGARIDISTGVVLHHDRVYFEWELTGGGADSPGMDFGELAQDGRLRRIVGFFGPIPDGTRVAQSYADYVSAWNEPDAAVRDALLDPSYGTDADYADPTVSRSGRAELSDHIAGYQADFPGTRIEVTSSGSNTGDVHRVTWSVVGPAGDLYSGIDFFELDADDSIARVSSFFGPLPSLGEGGFARTDCKTCVELTQDAIPVAEEACVAGRSTSADRWAALQTCTCTQACAAQCGDNLCSGAPPSAECGACIGVPGNLLQACTPQFVDCVSDG